MLRYNHNPGGVMPRLSNDLLSSLIGHIYDCALNPDGWSNTLTQVTYALDAAYTTISLASATNYLGRMAAQSPWDAEQLRVLNEDYGVEGIPGLKTVLQNDTDWAFATLSNMSEPEFQSSKFYTDWAKPQGLRDGCVCKFVHTSDRIGVMAFITRASRDIISAEESHFFSLLSPHFRRAAMIGDLLDHERVNGEIYRATLDRQTTPIILVDGTGKITYKNASAESMFAAGDAIRSVGGKFEVNNQTSAAVLASAIAQTAKKSPSLGGRAIGLPISTPGQPPAVAYVLPLNEGTARADFGSATAAIFISTTTSSSPPPETSLVALFGLTSAEARVMSLGSGLSKEDAAVQLGISANTLKSQLGSVYGKTSTNSQHQLAKICAALSPTAQ
jgi:DNA-binding CsgD family transcriptional regulator/PAS domain-containing protein